MTPDVQKRPPVFRGFGEMLFATKFDNVKNFVTEVESFINSEVRKLGKEFDEAVKRLSKEERRDAEDYYSDVFYQYQEYTEILRRSLFSYIYSVIENMLNDLCNSERESKKLKLSLSDLSGKGIERAKNYLKKVAEIQFPAESGEWQELKVYNLVRNCLVHREGELGDSNDDRTIREWALRCPDCLEVKHDVVGREFLEIKRDLCYRALEVVRQFFRQLYQGREK